MRTLLVDNYDSYTFNLFQLLAEVNGAEPVVVRHDAATWTELAAENWDAIVISPGPGRPDRPADFGLCAELLRAAEVPVLGVCLGHQGIATGAGGRIEYAEPMHGRLSRIRHTGTGLFAGIPQGFAAVRYHSLVVAQPLPPSLSAIAWTEDGQVMALRDRERPRWGVQFHPESIATEHGRTLLANFRDHCGAPATPPPAPPAPATPPKYTVDHRELDRWSEPETAFGALFGSSSTALWLDSGRTDTGARFSYLCAPDGPLSQLITYDVTARQVTVRSGKDTRTHQGTLFDFLRAGLADGVAGPGLPFDFTGGYVGYLGYEVRADCGAEPAHRSPHPDAMLAFADRFLAFDHERHRVHLVALHTGDPDPGRRWFDRVAATLRTAVPLPEPDTTAPANPVQVRLTRTRERYLAQIDACLDQLGQGESYEICLTDRVRTGPLTAPPLDVYRVLRRINPAPYAAYLRFPGLDVLCSSPERFLRIDRDRWIEAKPIKGTAPRSADPATDAELARRLRTDEKTRAENLMIVDLLRNDLGAVSEIGTVHVPALMTVESYRTVHQLVSTVRGRLRADRTAVDCLATVFPGGSMTGAPKLRSMRIIDDLEGRARGIYSGTIGFLSLNGTADLNIVIRTIVADEHGTTIGAGGAIVAQSDPDEEYAETILKATAPLTAIAIAELGAPRSVTPATAPTH